MKYTQNEVIWDFESAQINRFDYMPMEKWILFFPDHFVIGIEKEGDAGV